MADRLDPTDVAEAVAELRLATAQRRVDRRAARRRRIAARRGRG